MNNDNVSVLTSLLNIDQLLIDSVASKSCDINYKTIEFNQLTNQRDPVIKSIIQRLMAELKNYDPLSKLSVDILKQELVVHLLRQNGVQVYKKETHKKGLSEQQLIKVNSYIESHYSTEITLKDLANLVNLSEYHFARLYKQVANITPYQYILRCRFERAQQLLVESNLTIQQIAFEIGYKDDSTFSKAFNKFFGMSPGLYRKRSRN